MRLLTSMLGLTLVLSKVTARTRLDLWKRVIHDRSYFTCDDNPYVNGCTVPSRTYKRALASECNKHDVCYDCGSRYGVSRRSCDITFGLNILEKCIDAMIPCPITTFLSYAGVRIFGRRRYSLDSPEWCAERWVKTCL